jgi:hypothetical protein
MKLLMAIIFLATACAVRAQTVANPSNVLHPLTKGRDGRYAPTSLDQDPSMKADLMPPAPAAPPHRSAILPPAQPAKPAEIVARIDPGLAASKISLLGTVNGLKGRFYVTNVGSQLVIPLVQLAVCDRKGFQVGSAAKTGAPLAPNDVEKMEVLATNLNAVDLKLVKLTAGPGKQ